MEWSAVEDELKKLIAANEDFSETTIRNAKDLLTYVSENCGECDGVSKGYWPTICFNWNAAQPDAISVEVFDSSYEFYVFKHQSFQVYEYDHVPGAPLPDELTECLKQIAL